MDTIVVNAFTNRFKKIEAYVTLFQRVRFVANVAVLSSLSKHVLVLIKHGSRSSSAQQAGVHRLISTCHIAVTLRFLDLK